MEILYRSRQLLCLAILSLLLCLTGCASHVTTHGQLPEKGSLPSFSARQGDSIHVSASGLSTAENEDLSSLVTSSFQSEKGMVTADTDGEADLSLSVHVLDVYLVSSASGGSEGSGSRTLLNTALGTMLGASVGAIAGNRTGAAIGAGLGAAMGLVASASDSQPQNTWAMRTEVTARSKDGSKDTRSYSVTAQGSGTDRARAISALNDRLAQDLVHASAR